MTTCRITSPRWAAASPHSAMALTTANAVTMAAKRIRRGPLASVATRLLSLRLTCFLGPEVRGDDR